MHISMSAKIQLNHFDCAIRLDSNKFEVLTLVVDLGLCKCLTQNHGINTNWGLQQMLNTRTMWLNVITNSRILFLVHTDAYFQQLVKWVLTSQTNKVSVHPAKTQISLGIRPVWSESSLSAWRNLGSLATHGAHSEDSDQTGRIPRLIRVFAGHTLTLLVLSWSGSNLLSIFLRVATKINQLVKCVGGWGASLLFYRLHWWICRVKRR